MCIIKSYEYLCYTLNVQASNKPLHVIIIIKVVGDKSRIMNVMGKFKFLPGLHWGNESVSLHVCSVCVCEGYDLSSLCDLCVVWV